MKSQDKQHQCTLGGPAIISYSKGDALRLMDHFLKSLEGFELEISDWSEVKFLFDDVFSFRDFALEVLVDYFNQPGLPVSDEDFVEELLKLVCEDDVFSAILRDKTYSEIFYANIDYEEIDYDEIDLGKVDLQELVKTVDTDDLLYHVDEKKVKSHFEIGDLDDLLPYANIEDVLHYFNKEDVLNYYGIEEKE